ncbi:MAG: branched-chain amino acid ABC transporter permease [Acidimicrobiales bacterium]
MQTVVLGILSGILYALIAVGITLVYKSSRVLNFAQAEVGTLALYWTWWISGEHKQPWILGALAAVVFAVAVCLVFERLFIRPIAAGPRVTLAVATIGLLALMIAIEAALFAGSIKQIPNPITHGGFTLAGVVIGPTEELALIVVVVIALALAAFLRFTDFGLGVLASADDPEAAQLMGISRAKVSAFTWGVSGGLSALAALLIEPSVGALAPGVFSGALFIGGLAAALLGGLSSLPGAFVGGVVVGVVEAEVKAHLVFASVPALQDLAMLVIVLLVLLLRPRGLLGRPA